MAKLEKGFGAFIIQLALALYLVVTGICLLGVGASISSSEIKALTDLFKGGTNVINIIIGIALIVYGVVVCIKALAPKFDLGVFDNVLKAIALILWIVVTLLSLWANKADLTGGVTVLHWLLIIAKNTFIIGAIVDASSTSK